MFTCLFSLVLFVKEKKLGTKSIAHHPVILRVKLKPPAESDIYSPSVSGLQEGK